MTLTTEMIRAGQAAAPQLSAVEIATVWRAICAAAPVAAQAQPDAIRHEHDWVQGPYVTDTMGSGWCVRIDGTDIFSDLNRYGCKGRVSFQIARGLASTKEAETALTGWLLKSVPKQQPVSGADELPLYVVFTRPGMVPERKGPYPTTALVEAALRELQAAHPDATSMVIRLPADCYPQSGVEWIDMHGDRSKGRLSPAQPQPSGNAGELPPMPNALDDVLADALSNLEHDNYERSYSGSKNRESDAALIRAALAQQASAGICNADKHQIPESQLNASAAKKEQ